MPRGDHRRGSAENAATVHIDTHPAPAHMAAIGGTDIIPGERDTIDGGRKTAQETDPLDVEIFPAKNPQNGQFIRIVGGAFVLIVRCGWVVRLVIH